ncbi:MAG: hypothetical protein GF364_06560 [Candidatus Lokiarchaeota archaeon]|nr:hypothetical protein [Candidatus Lokiarchaeota archaeon]
MKFNRFIYTRLVICLLMVNIFLIVDIFVFTETKMEETNKEENYSAVLGSVVADKIHIIGSNWSLAAQETWCSGSGTIEDPYLLENLEIDCLNHHTGIIIENSSVVFEIRNCTIFNIGSSESSVAGIKLVNATNGTIYGNTLATDFDGSFGIYGINLKKKSNYNVIDNNSIVKMEYGIYLENNCSYNSITNNKLTNTTDYSIYSLGTYDGLNIYNRYYENNITNCEKTAIYFQYSDNCTLDKNYIFNSSNTGIFLRWSDHVNITRNNINNSSQDGISVEGRYNSILGNNVNGSGINGIELNDDPVNLVYGNIINNSDGFGIGIIDSGYNTIKQNIVNNSGYSIVLMISAPYNDISKNYFGYYSVENAYEQDGLVGNTWNTSIAGNYWVDYTEGDSNGDGIGESTYNISVNEPAADFKPITGEFFYDGSAIQVDSNGILYENWTYTGSRYWCSGTGTENDPFLIENLQINAQNASCGVDIRNSNKYFKLVNLTLTNSSASAGEHSGIYLYSTDNGFITNCSVYDNGLYGPYTATGIEIHMCEYITILGCYIYNNSLRGIHIYSFSNDIQIFNSTIIENGYNGIEASLSQYLTIYGNSISNNTERNGIALSQVENSTISFNQVTENGGPEAGTWHGLSISACESNNITGNYFADNEQYNVHVVSNCHYNIFWLNKFDRSDSPTIVNMPDLNNEKNYWNSSDIGNIWYNYGAFSEDSDDDGIGDDPYPIPADYITSDYLPIYDDGFNGSKIVIDELGSHDWDWAETRVWLKGKGTIKEPYLLEDLKIDCEESESGIYIKNSYTNFRIENCTINSSEWGGFPNYNAAIKLENTSFGVIYNNNLSANLGAGLILFQNSSDNLIINNSLLNNKYGIYIFQGCHFNQIRDNYINASTNSGISITVVPGYEKRCNSTYIYNNVIKHCVWGINLHTGENVNGTKIHANNINHNDIGIRISDTADLYYHINLTISNNNITENNDKGIELAQINKSCIFQNNISYNSIINGYGIHLSSSVSNISVYLNNITHTLGIGLYIDEDANQHNQIYNNTFTSNWVNGEDNGTNNQWNTTNRGNYWDDYDGFDVDGDGIGETPYELPGDANVNDNFPEWYIRDVIAPTIDIINPIDNELLGYDAPSVTLDIEEYIIKSQNYSLDFGVTKIPFSGESVAIDEDEWNDQGNGTVTIRFYVEDLAGHLTSKDLILQKDIEPPVIDIIHPTNMYYRNDSLFDLNVSVYEYNLENIWYTLDDGLSNYTFGGNETINSELWEPLEDEEYVLEVYANDSIGNMASSSIQIIRDSTDPIIQISSPVTGTEHTEAPIFDVDITELNDYTTWYIILESDDTTLEYFTGFTGEIDEDRWNDLEGDKVYTVIFYIQDAAGNLDYDQISIKKLDDGSDGMPFWMKAVLSGIISAAVSLFIKQTYTIRKKKKEKTDEILEVLEDKEEIYLYVKRCLKREDWKEVQDIWADYANDIIKLKKAIEKSNKTLGISFYKAIIRKKDIDDISDSLKPAESVKSADQTNEMEETEGKQATDSSEDLLGSDNNDESIGENEKEEQMHNKKESIKSTDDISLDKPLEDEKDEISPNGDAFNEADSIIKLKKYMKKLFNMRDKIKEDYENGVISSELYLKKQDYIGKKLGEAASKLRRLKKN